MLRLYVVIPDGSPAASRSGTTCIPVCNVHRLVQQADGPMEGIDIARRARLDKGLGGGAILPLLIEHSFSEFRRQIGEFHPRPRLRYATTPRLPPYAICPCPAQGLILGRHRARNDDKH